MADNLPNLLIVGVSKGGTTSLFSYLGQHPEICPSAVKEPGFFSPIRTGGFPAMSLSDYAANFAACRSERYRMEATPTYFFGGPRLVEAVADTLPGVRALVSLRNPTDRLWSHYRYKTLRGRLDPGMTFEHFVHLCEQILSNPERAETAGPYRALFTGFYINFVGDWLDRLSDRFRVVFFDHIRKDPVGCVYGITDWLRLQKMLHGTFDAGVRNATIEPRSRTLHRAGVRVNQAAGGRLTGKGVAAKLLNRAYKRLNATAASERMDKAARERLDLLYRDSNLALGALLSEHGYGELPEWLTGSQRKPGAG